MIAIRSRLAKHPQESNYRLPVELAWECDVRINGVFFAALAALVFGFPGIARAEWRRAESPHFVVYGDLQEAEIRGTIEVLEQFDAALRALGNVAEDKSAPKLSVYIVTKSQLREVYPGLSDAVLGFYKSQPDLTAFVATNDEVEENLSVNGSRITQTITYLAARAIVQHEYAHHFMLQYYPGGYPKWYIEGFAEYFSTLSVKDGNIDLGDYSLGRVVSLRDGWTPMRTIMGRLDKKYSADVVNDLYAQGWLAVSYFFSTAERQKSLGKYLAAISGGEKDLDKAMLESTGMTYEQFDTALKEYMRGKITKRQFQGLKYAAPEIRVGLVPAAQARNLLLDVRIRLELSGDKAQQRRILTDKQKQWAVEPSDSFVQLLAARAEIAFGDAARGRELANAVAQSEPENAEAHYLVGLSLMEEGRKDETLRAQKFKEARPYFAKAFKRDPNHVGALYQTGLSLMETGNMNENTANVFLLAHQLAPQVGEISISTASALVSLGKREEAIALLQPVANNPHGGKLSEQAQAMIDGLQGVATSESEAAAPAPG